MEKNGRRSRLPGYRCFAGEDRKQVVREASAFIHYHYDLGNLTVLSNGDGGAGYSFTDFDDMVEGCGRHEHFRDKYHVNEKIRICLYFCPAAFVNKFAKAIGKNDSQSIRKQLKTLLDTAESLARIKDETEAGQTAWQLSGTEYGLIFPVLSSVE